MLRLNAQGSFDVQGLKEFEVNSIEQINRLIDYGLKNRQTYCTDSNRYF